MQVQRVVLKDSSHVGKLVAYRI